MTQSSEIRIAILEDNLDLREELIFFLQAKGFRAWGERSAEAFWKRLHADSADIMLLDIGLPGEDGFSVLEYLRGLGPYGLIVISARGSQQDRLRGMELGADAYLVKPVNFAGLVLTINQVWQRLSLQAPAANPSASSAPGESIEKVADRPSLEAALRQRVLVFVEQNIHSPELSPNLILRRFNVSRSHLYRAFAADGGVAKLLRNKRLDYAIQELTRAGGSAVSISELAHRLGFSSGNQFLRGFRERFGMTPSQAREKGACAARKGPGPV